MAAAPEPAVTGIFLLLLLLLIATPPATASDDTNHVYSPCSDAKVQRSDGFTFGLAFSRRESFFSGNGGQAVQLSPCDSRLGLAGSASSPCSGPRSTRSPSSPSTPPPPLSAQRVLAATWLPLQGGSMLLDPARLLLQMRHTL